jgi:hypothetical protein
MSDMKLTGVAREHLRVKDDTKSVTAYVEAFLRACGSPDFVLFITASKSEMRQINKKTCLLLRRNS